MAPHNGNSREIGTTPGQVDGDDESADQSVSSLAGRRFMPPTDGFDELALMRCRSERGWSSSTATSSSSRSRIGARQELQPCVASAARSAQHRSAGATVSIRAFVSPNRAFTSSKLSGCLAGERVDPGVHFGPKFLEVGAAYTNVVGTRRHTGEAPAPSRTPRAPRNPALTAAPSGAPTPIRTE